MAINKEHKADGIVSFSGGMETYLDQTSLSPANFYASVNFKVVSGKTGIQTRSGYREIYLDFGKKNEDKEFFQSNPIQGCGYYVYSGRLYILAACRGRIYEFIKQSDKIYLGRYTGFQVDATLPMIYFTNIPYNSVTIDDGISFAIIAKDGRLSRPNGDDETMPPGRGGIFIQNRKFVISQDGKSIWFSNFNDPLSRSDAILNNILLFSSPDDTEITALGEQKTIGRDTQGGSLIFSTQRNVYSINVTGPLSNWGNPSVPNGKIVSDIYNVSGVSSTSMVSMNGNTYFRSKRLGMVSLQYLNYIFEKQDVIQPQSYGGDLFFRSDEPAFLGNTYSVAHERTIYTTVSPQLENGGYVYWNGILTCSPGENGVIRWDSLHTGLRPYCLLNVEDPWNRDILHIFSKDYDGKNRLYVMDDGLNFDLHHDGKVVPIESKLFSRFYQFENPLLVKKTTGNMISVVPMADTVVISCFNRTFEADSFTRYHGGILKNKYTHERKGVFVNQVFKQPERKINLSASQNNSPQGYYSIQDLLCFKGGVRLIRHIRQAQIYVDDASVFQGDCAQNENVISEQEREVENFYTYKTHE